MGTVLLKDGLLALTGVSLVVGTEHRLMAKGLVNSIVKQAEMARLYLTYSVRFYRSSKYQYGRHKFLQQHKIQAYILRCEAKFKLKSSAYCHPGPTISNYFFSQVTELVLGLSSNCSRRCINNPSRFKSLSTLRCSRWILSGRAV
jgi:hypothetical protein